MATYRLNQMKRPLTITPQGKMIEIKYPTDPNGDIFVRVDKLAGFKIIVGEVSTR